MRDEGKRRLRSVASRSPLMWVDSSSSGGRAGVAAVGFAVREEQDHKGGQREDHRDERADQDRPSSRFGKVCTV
jgi:hypothetical protein